MAVPKARPGSSWWRCQRHDQVVAVPRGTDQVRGVCPRPNHREGMRVNACMRCIYNMEAMMREGGQPPLNLDYESI